MCESHFREDMILTLSPVASLPPTGPTGRRLIPPAHPFAVSLYRGLGESTGNGGADTGAFAVTVSRPDGAPVVLRASGGHTRLFLEVTPEGAGCFYTA